MTLPANAWKGVDLMAHPDRIWLEMQRDIETMTKTNVTLDIRF